MLVVGAVLDRELPGLIQTLNRGYKPFPPTFNNVIFLYIVPLIFIQGLKIEFAPELTPETRHLKPKNRNEFL
jgi:hypothetical protein